MPELPPKKTLSQQEKQEEVTKLKSAIDMAFTMQRQVRVSPGSYLDKYHKFMNRYAVLADFHPGLYNAALEEMLDPDNPRVQAWASSDDYDVIMEGIRSIQQRELNEKIEAVQNALKNEQNKQT